MNEEMKEKAAVNARDGVTASFSCCGCLIAIALTIASIALGILALKYAVAFLVWAWKLQITF